MLSSYNSKYSNISKLFRYCSKSLQIFNELQSRYELFIGAQKKIAEKQKKYAIIHLERLVKTQW